MAAKRMKYNQKKVSDNVQLSEHWWQGKTHVLLDMDGTLIAQPGFIFHNLFAVLALFRFSKLATVREVLTAFQKTKTILLSKHPFSSNKEAFFETLASELKVARAMVERFSNKFFDTDYPFLCLFLHSDPDARRLIDALRARQMHITLATNAVFGRKEIELRLQASNLYLHDFDLVTSWDVMKTTKPHSDFFNETLQLIGGRPQSTVMIGNDPHYDLPAHKLGINTLLVGPTLNLGHIADSLTRTE